MPFFGVFGAFRDWGSLNLKLRPHRNPGGAEAPSGLDGWPLGRTMDCWDITRVWRYHPALCLSPGRAHLTAGLDFPLRINPEDSPVGIGGNPAEPPVIYQGLEVNRKAVMMLPIPLNRTL